MCCARTAVNGGRRGKEGWEEKRKEKERSKKEGEKQGIKRRDGAELPIDGCETVK